MELKLRGFALAVWILGASLLGASAARWVIVDHADAASLPTAGMFATAVGLNILAVTFHGRGTSSRR